MFLSNASITMNRVVLTSHGPIRYTLGDDGRNISKIMVFMTSWSFAMLTYMFIL
jgi:hypothetical protein